LVCVFSARAPLQQWADPKLQYLFSAKLKVRWFSHEQARCHDKALVFLKYIQKRELKNLKFPYKKHLSNKAQQNFIPTVLCIELI
jgi:hypothetical protein